MPNAPPSRQKHSALYTYPLALYEIALWQALLSYKPNPKHPLRHLRPCISLDPTIRETKPNPPNSSTLRPFLHRNRKTLGTLGIKGAQAFSTSLREQSLPKSLVGAGCRQKHRQKTEKNARERKKVHFWVKKPPLAIHKDGLLAFFRRFVENAWQNRLANSFSKKN